MLPAPFFTEWPDDLGDERSFMATHAPVTIVSLAWLAEGARALAAASRRLACWCGALPGSPSACA